MTVMLRGAQRRSLGTDLVSEHDAVAFRQTNEVGELVFAGIGVQIALRSRSAGQGVGLGRGRFVEMLTPSGTPTDLASCVRFHNISYMVRQERAVMHFCRLRMVPFVGERPHPGGDDRNDNNEIHGNLPSCRGVVRGRRWCSRSCRTPGVSTPPKSRCLTRRNRPGSGPAPKTD